MKRTRHEKRRALALRLVIIEGGERDAYSGSGTLRSEQIQPTTGGSPWHSLYTSITSMNRSGPTDSKLSLDAEPRSSDFGGMIAQPYQLYVERKDPSINMARFYAMDISATLFGQACLTRRWGRIGARGQSKTHLFTKEEEAVSLFLDLLRQKQRRGYRPREEVDQ